MLSVTPSLAGSPYFLGIPPPTLAPPGVLKRGAAHLPSEPPPAALRPQPRVPQPRVVCRLGGLLCPSTLGLFPTADREKYSPPASLFFRSPTPAFRFLLRLSEGTGPHRAWGGHSRQRPLGPAGSSSLAEVLPLRGLQSGDHHSSAGFVGSSPVFQAPQKVKQRRNMCWEVTAHSTTYGKFLNFQ